MLDRLFCIESTSFDPSLTLGVWKAPRAIGQSQSEFDGLAILSISGTLLRSPTRFDFRDTCSLQSVEMELNRISADESINRVLVMIDSPGGSVAGIESASNAFASLSKKKPTYAFVDGVCASAGYWLISSAKQIWAPSSSIIGSIGTFICVPDTSAMFAKMGIVVHKVSSAPLKGVGETGTEITPEAIDDLQRVVNAINQLFLDAISVGRNMPAGAVQEIATGQVWLSSEARQLGLIDVTGSFEDCLWALNHKHGSTQQRAPRPKPSDDDHFPTRSKYTER